MERGEGQLHLGFHPGCPCHATSGGVSKQIVKKGALPGPRLASNHNGCARAGARVGEEPIQSRTLGAPVDKRSRRFGGRSHVSQSPPARDEIEQRSCCVGSTPPTPGLNPAHQVPVEVGELATPPLEAVKLPLNQPDVESHLDDLVNRAQSDATSSLTLKVARLSSLCNRTCRNAWSAQGREAGLRRPECEDAIRAIRTTQGWRLVRESGCQEIRRTALAGSVQKDPAISKPRSGRARRGRAGSGSARTWFFRSRETRQARRDPASSSVSRCVHELAPAGSPILDLSLVIKQDLSILGWSTLQWQRVSAIKRSAGSV